MSQQVLALHSPSMPSIFRRAETTLASRLRRKPPSGFAARATFWLSVTIASLLILRLLHLFSGDFADVLLFLLFAVLAVCAAVLLWRWTFRHLLWRVRNRLIVTYLLMGLAPVVLFMTLAGIAAYLFSGQFATYTAIAELDAQEEKLSFETRAFAIHVGHTLASNPNLRSLELPESEAMASDNSLTGGVQSTSQHMPPGLEITALQDGTQITLTTAHRTLASRVLPPFWVRDGFHGLVIDGGRLYFRAVDTHVVDAHKLVVLSSLPLTDNMLTGIAHDLGRLSIVQGFEFRADQADQDPDVALSTSQKPAKRTTLPQRLERKGDLVSLSGGALPAAAHFYDQPVAFSAPLAVVDWRSGARESNSLLLNVTSRPTLLYQRLFSNSVRLATIVRDGLITIAVLFGLLELAAFIMAVGLNRTITRSIQDLYSATRAIDSGNFEHRIHVQRRDQLAALSNSFNSMSQSLAHLLQQQREKERLQSELAIAHEVQNSLLPQGQIRLSMLEVHGTSKPARSVSGDYYDFLLTGSSQLALALGDISGKGISAALLMASLHSAVRAYRFGESGHDIQSAIGEANILAKPALMLERLNRHLYASTQPEKYATLFLAHYDGESQTLTYSNGGQLPPFVLCSNGEVKRLECGGSVVGLLDGMKYEQARVSMTPGDILIIYSDGVTEPENEFGDFGETRLLDTVARNRTLSLEAISQHVMHALQAWIGDQEQPLGLPCLESFDDDGTRFTPCWKHGEEGVILGADNRDVTGFGVDHQQQMTFA